MAEDNREVTNLPFLRVVTPFLAAGTDLTGAHVALIGAPFDGTTSFRPGTRFGPERIRSVSYGLETYSPLQDAELSPSWLADVGDLELPLNDTARALEMIEEAVAWLAARGLRPLLLGGEHTVTVGAVRALAGRYPDLVVVQLDAHADWRDEYDGDRLSHATTVRRASEVGGGRRVIQIGIRSGTRQEFQEAAARGDFYPGVGPAVMEEVGKSLAAAGVPVYLTIDIDVLDPAFAPGTGTPEPGGWTSGELLVGVASWARSLPRLVGADLVEVSPPVDVSDITSIIGSKLVRELALLLYQASLRWQ
ncbi:MAG: agmatinase [Limnochordales bacterium]|nr:agmatinase [Limnochordales bacterium]